MDKINSDFIPTIIISRSSSSLNQKDQLKINSNLNESLSFKLVKKKKQEENCDNSIKSLTPTIQTPTTTTTIKTKIITDKTIKTIQKPAMDIINNTVINNNNKNQGTINNNSQIPLNFIENLTYESQLSQLQNYFMYNGQLINNSLYSNITLYNNKSYYRTVNVTTAMMTPLSIMQSQFQYETIPNRQTGVGGGGGRTATRASTTIMSYVPICQILNDDTNDLQKEHNISHKKLNSNDSNQQNYSTNSHHNHHHHHNYQQQQQQQQSKSIKSSKARHNKRGTNNTNNSVNNNGNNDNKPSSSSSHSWLASSNIKGHHANDIHDIEYSNNRKFLASCGEATNTSNSTNGLLQHHHHPPSHRIIRNDKRKDSSSTDSTGSGTDDINNSSSNEDSSVSYVVSKLTKSKKSKSGRNRRQQKNQSRRNNIDTETDNYNHQKNNNKNRTEQSEVSSSSSSSLNSSPTASPQQKSSLRSKTTKNSTKIVNIKQNNGSNESSNHHHHHHHHHHHTHQKDKTCELNHFVKISRAVIPPLRQHTKLNLQESELVKFLRYYVVDPNLLRIYGYPVESASYEGSVEIFKCLPRPFTHFKTNGTVNNNNRNVTTTRNNIINKNDGLIPPPGYKKWKRTNINDDTEDSSNIQLQSSDSGNGSETSSPISVDSDDVSENGEEETTTTFYTPDGSYQIFNNYSQSLKKQCVRCKKEFLVDENGEYLTKEECFYHWGKLQQIYTSNRTFGFQYTCCNGDQTSIGCSKNCLHVWTGITVGINGPYNDFVRTTKKIFKQYTNNIINDNDNDDDYDYDDDNNVNYDNNNCNDNISGDGNHNIGKVYALDCEMCFTGLGLELTKITIVGSDGHLVYEAFVKPKCEIVDYNTRFSGITEKDIQSKNNNVKTLEQVQNDLLDIIDEDTLLIGHALDNDLRVLKIIHTNIIDTSVTFPHVNGFPYRRALKTLTKYFLNRDIQMGGESGHCSFEDSRACLELMLWRVRKDFRLILEQ